MPQATATPRKKTGDSTSPSFDTPPKINTDQLNLGNIGVNSPELALNRLRYQATRTNTASQKIPTNLEPDLPINQASQPTDQVEDILEESPINSIGQTSTDYPNQVSSKEQKESSDKPKDNKEKGDSGKEKKSSQNTSNDKKEDSQENKSPNNNKSKETPKNTKPDAQGGGTEQKDPGVKPQALPESKDSKKPPEKSEQKSDDAQSTRLGQAKIAALKDLKNAQDKLKSGNLSGAIEGATAASKVASSWALTTMWGAVWLDWTLLTLLGLNVYFVVSSFTDKIASFGEDYLFGKWMPKELAKWFEIMLMVLIDMIVLSVFFMILYGGYKFYTMSFTKTFFGFITGGTEGAIKANLD